MLERFACSNPFGWVVPEQRGQEVEPLLSQKSKVFTPVAFRELFESPLFYVWQFVEAFPHPFVWSSQHLEDLVQRFNFSLGWEKRLLGQQFCKNAPN